MSADGNYYLVLELKPGSDLSEIKSQYRLLAKRYHPDLHGNDPQSQEKFRQVHAAYEFLSDPARKAAYDHSLLTPKVPPPAKSAVSSAPKSAPNPARPRPVRLPDYPPPSRTPFEAFGEIKASRSVWFGGAAIAVILLLGIGFCWENGISQHDEHSGAVYGFSVNPAPSQLEPGGSSSGPVAPPPDVTPETTPSDDLADAAPIVPLPLPPPPPVRKTASAIRAYRIAPRPNFGEQEKIKSVAIAASPNPAPQNRGFIGRGGVASAVAAPKLISTREVVQPLLARYRAVVPQVDLLINRGYALCDANQNDGRSRHLKADLTRLDAVRDRVRPEIERLPRKAEAKELSREVKPILADLRQLEASPQPVQEDIQTLASMPAAH